jgi:hypothetical protein
MKKIAFLFSALFITSFSSGQNLPLINSVKPVLKTSKKASILTTNQKATTDTAGLSSIISPQFGEPDMTIQSFWMSNGNGDKIGYWFGTSNDTLEYDKWAQCWDNSGTVYISGILFFAGGKTQLSAGTGSDLIVGIQKMNPYTTGTNGCVIDAPMVFDASPANPYLGQATVNIANFDTSFLAFNYVPFPSLAGVTGNFCAIADFKAMRLAGDTAYLFSDTAPDGLGWNFTQYYLPAFPNYFWMSTYFSGDNPDLDVNMAIFAIIDDGAGIEDEGYFQGIKMSLRNNPAIGNAYVDYELEHDSPVKLFVFDRNGKEVSITDEGTKKGGSVNSISVNTDHLAKGLYFLSLLSKEGRFTKKMIIE